MIYFTIVWVCLWRYFNVFQDCTLQCTLNKYTAEPIFLLKTNFIVIFLRKKLWIFPFLFLYTKICYLFFRIKWVFRFQSIWIFLTVLLNEILWCVHNKIIIFIKIEIINDLCHNICHHIELHQNYNTFQYLGICT